MTFLPAIYGVASVACCTLAALFAAYSCFRAARDSAARERLLWIFLSAGGLLAAVPHAVWLVAARTTTPPAATAVGFALWATLSYFVFIGFYLAVFLKPHRLAQWPVRPAVVVDTLLAGSLLLTLQFYFSAAYRVSPAAVGRGLAGALLAALLGIVCAGALAGCRRQAGDLRWSRIYAIMIPAALSMGASRAAFILLHKSYDTALAGSSPLWMSLPDFLETAGFAFLAFAARQSLIAPGGVLRPEATAGDAGLATVWRDLAIPVLVLLGVLSIPLIDRWFTAANKPPAEIFDLRDATLVGAMGICVLLLLARQFLVQMENRDLALDLHQESARLRLLVDNIQDAVITEDLGGRLIFVNQRFLDMFGLERSQIKHLRLDDCIHPEDRRVQPGRQPSRLSDPVPGGRFEFRGLRRDGGVLYLESSAAPVCLRGMILGHQSVIRDITERRQAEQKRRELIQRLEFLVSHMPLGCIVFDLDSRILEWNSAASRIFGWGTEEVFGRDGLELLVPPEARPSALETWNDLQRYKSSSHGTNRNLTKDRGVIDCEWFNTSLIDEAGCVVAVASMVQDITERKNLEARLRQSQKMEAVGLLAGGIAHDFNNLLTIIVGNVSLAMLRLDDAHPAQRGLRDADQAAARASELVQQLLGFSRKGPSQPRAISLNSCVQEAVEMLSRTLGPRIAMEAREQKDLWLVQADKSQVNQILMNLCMNARDAMDGAGTITIRTENRNVDSEYCRSHPEARPGEYVAVRVTDTGAGMDAATLSRIFEPFFTTKQVGKGTGLGLAMVYGIVQQHDGWITVDSEPGKGSTFSILFPRSRKIAKIETPSLSPPSAEGTETILLVDDEEMIRSLARRILESNGYTVIEAHDGEDAVETFKKELFHPSGDRIDLVLLDMTMPGKSGRDTLIEIQRLAPQVPVILASGYAPVGKDDLASLGARAFISKPYRPENLVRVLRSVLDAIPQAVSSSLS